MQGDIGLSGKAAVCVTQGNLMPSSAAMISAAFAPMTSAVLYVLAPTFPGQMERSSKAC